MKPLERRDFNRPPSAAGAPPLPDRGEDQGEGRPRCGRGRVSAARPSSALRAPSPSQPAQKETRLSCSPGRRTAVPQNTDLIPVVRPPNPLPPRQNLKNPHQLVRPRSTAPIIVSGSRDGRRWPRHDCPGASGACPGDRCDDRERWQGVLSSRPRALNDRPEYV